MSKLNDKVAVITGGSSGIGLATAERFIADGAQVVVTGRDRKALDAAVAELGERATGIRGDVANLDDLDRLFAQVREQFGRVDVLFANAGIAPFVPFEAELSPRGIRGNVVSPGLIETPLVGKLGLSPDELDAFAEQVVQRTPLGRPGRAEEIAATVAFLASDDASYFTGADLVADGGMIQV